MSYNISTWKRISGSPLRISKRNATRLARKFEDDHPEGWFIDDLEFDENGCAQVPDHLLYGEGAAYFYHDHFDEIAAALEGSADYLITWERGDSFTGVRVAEGEAVEMDVVMTLKRRR